MDLVVNAVLLAAVKTARAGPGGPMGIYHSGTSTVRPVRWSETGDAVVTFWKRRCRATQAQQDQLR